jgi:hypothetical protein
LRSVLYFSPLVFYHKMPKGVIVAPWSIAMIDRSLRQQFLLLLAIVACLSMSLQAGGHLSFSEAATGTLRCVDASLVTASTLPTDTPGEAPCCDEYSPAESLVLIPGLSGTALSQQRSILITARTSLAEGCPAEIYRPPIVTV